MPVRIGTCSWKYPSWQGLVYSRAAGINYLEEYARRFTTVEVDQWFWAPPEPRTAAEYAAATPYDFRFTIKAFNGVTLTHFYRKKGEAALRPNPDFLSVPVFRDFRSRLTPLEGRIGVLMLQFEYLSAEKMGSSAEFLSRLGGFMAPASRAAGDVPLAIETRNPSWLDQTWFTWLAERGLSHVFLQGCHMPPITGLYRRYAGLLRDPVVVRLHGPDRGGIEKATGEHWDRIVAPRDDELRAVVDMVNDLSDRGFTVWLNVNNHYEGSAPLTIERLRGYGLRSVVNGAAGREQ